MSGYLAEETGKVILAREAEFVVKPLELSHLASKVYKVLLRKELNQS